VGFAIPVDVVKSSVDQVRLSCCRSYVPVAAVAFLLLTGAATAPGFAAFHWPPPHAFLGAGWQRVAHTAP
jgi:hypothetical protein